MKREEIDKLPDSISFSSAQAILQSLGLEPRDVVSLHMEGREIRVEVIATNEKGRAYAGANGSFARHSISFKVEEAL